MKKKLFLVDVSSMYFRAYYAVRPLNTSKGLPTNALFGFLSMSVKLLRDMKPDYLAYCFDRPDPSFRKEIYSEYKANRTEMPEDLVPQVPYVRKITHALGIHALDMKGFEADDIIGTLAVEAQKSGVDVVIISGDKDFAQLINSNVSMYDTLKDVKYDPQGVVDKWGIPPEQFMDYLALTGDSSDNIPGVDGIGPKGAQKLLSEYKSIAGIYKNLDDIKNKNLQTKLAAGKENAFLSLKLVEINKEVPLQTHVNDLKMKEIHRDELSALLDELEFQSFKKSLLGGGAVQKVEVETEFKKSMVPAPQSVGPISELSLTPVEAEKVFKNGATVWGLDTLRGLYVGINEKVYRLEGDPGEFGKVFSDKNLRWCGYNIKKFWHDIKIERPSAAVDLMLMEYLLKGGKVDGIDGCYQLYVGGKFPDLPSGADFYSCYLKLWESMAPEVEKKKMNRILETIDVPLIPVLYAMEKKGILVNKNELWEQSMKLTEEIKELEKIILKEAGTSFNIGSPKQLSEVLFTKMKIPPVKKTKTGFSTDSDVLEKLSAEYPICLHIIQHREIAKLKSTYLDSLPTLISPLTGRVHTHFNQVGTTTGRLSSHDPNLQNIPIRTERGQKVRRAFIADKNYELISSDYSQIELRLMAHITGDQGLVEAFASDQDIHTATASSVFNVKAEAVTADMRRTAKAINFGIAYGQGAFGLAESLGISRTESSEIIKNYFNKYKKVKDYMTDVVEDAKKNGFVETVFGRRRYLPELKSANQAIRKFGERAAINAPMQGTAADLVKLAMIETFKNSKDSEMLLQVHDELLFEAPVGNVESEVARVKKTMESIVELKVPLKVNVSHGKNWDEAH
jgi:DNA polymerase I